VTEEDSRQIMTTEELALHPATRYVVPLREGGSLPAVLDTEGGGLFVTKFRGAGQGARALIAEILVARLAAAAGLDVPEVALIELDDSFDKTVRDAEIADILRGSRGLNVGLRYLESAFNFEPEADQVDAGLAARIVWLDALVSNIDRTARNPNLLWWDDRVWLIDHGAALYFHHDWGSVTDERARTAFAGIGEHVLLDVASDLVVADSELAAAITTDVIEGAVDSVPDELLMDAPSGMEPPFATAQENRDAYRRYFEARLAPPRAFVEGALEAQRARRSEPRRRKEYRR
jgi:hypothetical protein